jgi:hypothetical protein
MIVSNVAQSTVALIGTNAQRRPAAKHIIGLANSSLVPINLPINKNARNAIINLSA